MVVSRGLTEAPAVYAPLTRTVSVATRLHARCTRSLLLKVTKPVTVRARRGILDPMVAPVHCAPTTRTVLAAPWLQHAPMRMRCPKLEVPRKLIVSASGGGTVTRTGGVLYVRRGLGVKQGLRPIAPTSLQAR
jgi:hypothetical protein